MPWFGGTRSVTIAGAVMSLPRPSRFWSCWRRRLQRSLGTLKLLVCYFGLFLGRLIISIGILLYWHWFLLLFDEFISDPISWQTSERFTRRWRAFSRERMQANTLHHLSTGRRVPRVPHRQKKAPELSSRSTGSSACSTTCCPATWRRTMAMVAAFTCDESLLSQSGTWGNSFVKHVLFEGCTSYPYCSVNWVILSIFNPFKQ